MCLNPFHSDWQRLVSVMSHHLGIAGIEEVLLIVFDEELSRLGFLEKLQIPAWVTS